MKAEDKEILADVYLSLVSEKVCKRIYTIIDQTKNHHIPGTTTLGEAFYYALPVVFDRSWEEIGHLNRNDRELLPIVIITMCRYALRKRL